MSMKKLASKSKFSRPTDFRILQRHTSQRQSSEFVGSEQDEPNEEAGQDVSILTSYSGDV